MSLTSFEELKYKNIIILANCKQYSQWTVDETGRPYFHHHDFEGADVISYTTDEYPDVEFETIEELKSYIDKRSK